MKAKTAFVGLKLEPKLKKDAQKRADSERVKLSHWIREAIIVRLSVRP